MSRTKIDLLASEMHIIALSEKMNKTVNETRDFIKNCSFIEYLQLSEATVDRNPDLMSGTSKANPMAQMQDPADELDPTKQKPVGNTPVKEPAVAQKPAAPGQEEKPYIMQGNNKVLVDIESSFGDNVTVKDDQGKTSTVPKDSVYGLKDAWNDFTTGFSKGSAAMKSRIGENENIERMKELAGMKSPTIVGNTADSHKPTVKLRKKERLSQDRAERQMDNKSFLPEPVVKKPVPDSAARYYRQIDRK